MSWSRSRDSVFTTASGSHIKDSLFTALLLLHGHSSGLACESHSVMNRTYKHSFNQGVVWGEFFESVFITPDQWGPLLWVMSVDKKEDLHQIFISSFPRGFNTTANHWLLSYREQTEHNHKTAFSVKLLQIGALCKDGYKLQWLSTKSCFMFWEVEKKGLSFCPPTQPVAF